MGQPDRGELGDVDVWRLSRHRTAVWVRWAAILSSLLQFATAQPAPISRRAGFAAVAFAAAYNTVAWGLGWRRGRLADGIRAGVVIGDFVSALAFVLLLIPHATAVAYFAFTLVGIEAGILYTTRGFAIFTAALLPTLVGLYRLQLALGYAVPFDDWLYVPAVVLTVALMVALVTRNGDRQHEQVVRLSITDPLTGLANPRAFGVRLETEVRRAQRQDNALALLTLDLDQFKAINDTRGHAAGDDALRAFGRVLSSRLLRAEVDYVARIGGEEFCVILPDTRLEQAVSVADRLCRAVAARGSGVGTTVSIGAAELAPGESAGHLRQRSDRALYRAKEQGRDRVAADRTWAGASSGPSAAGA